jgi:hypothetical protein
MRPGARFTAQVLAMLAFGAVSIIALYVDPTIGACLVAAGLLGHALWDAEHYRRDAVVARPYAEFCGVLDLLLAAVVVVVLVA